jgi:hypothetical protein
MHIIRWVCGALVLSVLAGAAGAQEYFPTPTVGVRSGYAFTQQSVTAGISSSVPIGSRLEIVLGGDLVLKAEDERWRMGADLVVRVGAVGEYYGGAGLALFDFRRPELTNRSEFGYTIVVGREFRRAEAASLRPFIEPRWSVVGGRTMFALAAGINYALETPF